MTKGNIYKISIKDGVNLIEAVAICVEVGDDRTKFKNIKIFSSNVTNLDGASWNGHRINEIYVLGFGYFETAELPKETNPEYYL